MHLVFFILLVLKSKKWKKKRRGERDWTKMQLYLFLSFLIPIPVIMPAGHSEFESKRPDNLKHNRRKAESS